MAYRTRRRTSRHSRAARSSYRTYGRRRTTRRRARRTAGGRTARIVVQVVGGPASPLGIPLAEAQSISHAFSVSLNSFAEPKSGCIIALYDAVMIRDA